MKRQANGWILAVLILASCVQVSCARAEEPERVWKDASGSYEVRATLIEVENGQAVLRRSDDQRELRVPIARLSAADQRYLRRRPPAENSAKPAATATTDWPRWRGPANDGHAGGGELLTEWDNPPEELWRISGLGQGYSSLAVVGERIYTLGERDGGQYLIALQVADGKEVWATRVGDPGLDGPNGTPTVDGERVYAIGIHGDLLCADAENGKEIWRKSFAGDFQGKMMSQWGYSESPLIDGPKLICTPGGARAMLVALDKTNGRPLWAAPEPPGQRGKSGAGYSSVVISNAGGVKQYVQLIGRGLIGVDAQRGRLLWAYNRIANSTANVPSPVVQGDFVLTSSGYNDGGTALLHLSKGRGQFNVREVYYHGANVLQNHHGGMILVGDHVYLGEGHGKGLPTCLNLKTGKPAWGPLRGPGSNSAAITYADGHLYFRYEDGTVALIEATPYEYRLKGTFRASFGSGPKWSHPVIANGKLYLRSHGEMACYNVAR